MVSSYWNTSGGYRTSSDWHLRDSYNGGRRANVSKNGLTTGEESMHTGNEYGFILDNMMVPRITMVISLRMQVTVLLER